MHVTHARRGYKRSCKFWLEPKVELDENKTGYFTDQELNEIEQLVNENKEILLSQLEIFYKQQPLKAIRK